MKKSSYRFVSYQPVPDLLTPGRHGNPFEGQRNNCCALYRCVVDSEVEEKIDVTWGWQRVEGHL